MSQKVFPITREWTFSNHDGATNEYIQFADSKESTFIHKAEALGFYKCKCNQIVCNDVKANEDDKVFCGCGLAVDEHSPDTEQDLSGSKWNRDRCTIRNGPTDAYGSISFLGASEIISQYIKIHYQTEINSIINYLFEKPQYWHLPKPKLIISVTGGAKINLKPRLKDGFSKGLVKVATTTNALIITGGSHNGCMKLVGEAFKNNALSIDLAQRIVLLGITNWGSVANKEKLVKDPNSNPSIPVEYDMIKQPSPYYKSELLDPNHSHFLLVDDSTVKFGGESQFRAAVEAEVSKKYNIPLVVLVVGGGPRTIDLFFESANKGSPVVLLEGSGESADIMVFALKKFDEERKTKEKTDLKGEFQISDKLRQEILVKFKKDYPKKEEPEINKMANNLIMCLNVDLRHLFTVCRHNDDIDVAILNALLHSESNSHMSKSDKQKHFQIQLGLALTWNRVDIAKDFIFTDELKDQIGSLDNLMFKAMLMNRVDFVRLFLENGFGLKNFVTHRLLLKLYNSIPQTSPFYQLIMKQKQLRMGRSFKSYHQHFFRFKSIGEAIQKVTKNIYQHRFTQEPFSSLNYKQSKEIDNNTDEYGKRIAKGESQVFRLTLGDQKCVKLDIDSNVENPEHELFIFNVLLGRSEMSKLFCQYGDDSICSSLFATIIFKSYAELYDANYEEYEELEKDFETFALEMLETYYNKDDDRASASLLRQIKIYDDCTSMQVAVAGKNLSFIAHPCFQNVLINYWYGRILPDVTKKSLALATFIPLLAPVIVRFKKEIKRHEPSAKASDEEAPQQAPIKETQMNSIEYSTETEEEMKNQQVNFEDSNYFKKLYYFVTTPFVKFIYHQIFFILFLILYSYVLLCDFYPINNTTNMWKQQGLLISVPEIVLIVWVLTFALEKVREFSRVERSMTHAKVREFFFDQSTLFDLAAICGFFIGEILRFIPNQNCYLAARILLCINIILWYMKSMYSYKFLQSVGPKVYMIKKMSFQLLFFLLIVVLFMFAFGVSTQALLYHNQALNSDLLKSVFFPSYFVIGGEYYTKDYFLDTNALEDPCNVDPITLLTDIYDPITRKDCPESTGSIVGLILYVIYLIFLNILLVNLLIAIFNNTYQTIESEANKIWKSDRYNLVFTYYYKPLLPPPFLIFSYILYAIQFIIRKILSLNGFNSTRSKMNSFINFFISEPKQGFVYEFSDKNKENNLIRWEAYNTDEYIFNLEKKSKETIDYRLEENGQKLEDLCEKFDEILENQNFELTTQIDGINKNIMALLKALK